MRNLKAIRAAMVRMYQDTGYAPAQLSDLVSATKPTNVYQCNRLATGTWTSVAAPTDLTWNGPYLMSKPADPPGTSGGFAGAHWGLWGYNPTVAKVIYADSTKVMSNGQTYQAYTQAN